MSEEAARRHADLPLPVRDALAAALCFALGDRRGKASLQAVEGVFTSEESSNDAHADATRRVLEKLGWQGDEPWSEDARARVSAYLEVASGGPIGVTLHDRLAQARALFERRLYFEVHEVLEPPWVYARDPERRWLQGAIQAAVSWHHWDRGNVRGATSLARAAADKLRGSPREWCGFPLGELGDAVEGWLDWLQTGARDRPPARAFDRSWRG